MVDTSSLFRPFSLGKGIELENRFVLSPMVTNSSSKEGYVSREDVAYAKRRAASAPLQITGAAYVNPYGQLFEFGFSVAKDEDIAGLRPLAQAMKAEGARAILQLTHAGRFSSHTLAREGFVYGPSPMQLQSPFPHEVKALSLEQIKGLVDDYRQATRRAIAAGFDGVEVSSAQRLLIQTFFSTFSNQRTDDYGAQDFASRARLTLEILEAVQEVIAKEANGPFLLGFRATPEETRGNQIGYSIEEFLQLMEEALARVPLAYLAIASWGHDVFRNRVRSKGIYQGLLVNDVVYRHLKGRLPIMATGGINSPEKAVEALAHADLVGASTPFIVDPEFVHKIRQDRVEEIHLRIKATDLPSLAIPQASFKDIVPLMDYGESLPAEARSLFRGLATNYREETS
ncbi:NADH-dependent flavin oxidoreductase [Streptococcus acidominimus]|uniref:NADH-dependent flavin oxidoreductase n=1 Tax=Streptococcus acidominimus TaxID=1326 RepID=A0A4Y9FQP8_STRAI|nr:NADH-dependent flavin oxidoreductase [Streptococcus acidominimus]MBF0818259.1 NADH-dependent flavin oxidoreductase [Streptococcus acidominimus]MBF0838576.1 NADH-dependent flavin oxidoreductase [Streptococcus acidominimus]MBF0848386.1 NADH-dependent flavin oxidoreductase [Streptococcus danieliae]TFU31557.1 NADH-dependent flavin oxidoreductase [Streptococcus acidominimus]